MDWVSAALALANNVFETTNKVLSKKDKKKFETLYRLHQEETKKNEDNRDHDLIAWLEDDLKPFITKAVQFSQGPTE